MDEKARGEAVAESTKRLGEESSPQASTLVPIYHGQSRTPVPTKDTLHFLKNVL